SEVGVADLVERANYLLGVPGGADLASGIAGVEQAEQLRAATVIESFVDHGEQSPGSVERVVFAAPVAEGLVLDPAADLVEPLVGQRHEVERVCDLAGVGEHRVEREPPRARE